MSLSELTAAPHEQLVFVYPENSRQNRWSIFFRAILAIPALVWWYLVGIAAAFAVFGGWFAALFTGRLPRSIASFVHGYLGLWVQVEMYYFLLTGTYPTFGLGQRFESAPRIEVEPGPLNRLAVLFRAILVIPAYLLSALAYLGMGIFSVIGWVLALFLGRLPVSIFAADVGVLRYWARAHAYFFMLTSTYPRRLFGDREGSVQPPPPPPAAWPLPPVEEAPSPWVPAPTVVAPAVEEPNRSLVLGTGSKVLLAAFLVIGAGAYSLYGSFFAASHPTIATAVARIEVATNYQSAVSATRVWSQAIVQCENGGNSPQCIENATQQLAIAYTTAADNVEALSLPGSGAEQATFVADLRASAADANRFASSMSSASAARAAGSALQASLSQIDLSYRALIASF